VTADVRRRCLKRLAKLALVLLVLFLMLRWFEHKQTYHPSRSFELTGEALQRPWEDVTFTASDGVRLNGWFFPANTNSPRGSIVLLICHGNGGNISHRLELYDLLLQTGVNVFAFDYRGYGRSEGRPSEAGTYLDAQAAYAWLKQRGFIAANLIAYGESLGGGIASELALRETVGGLVLHSTFTSVTEVGAELFPYLPVRMLGSIRYDTRSKLPKILVPVIILHGRMDTLIRFHHAENNFAAANEPKRLVEITGDHNDGIGNPEKYLADIQAYLDALAGSDAMR
jgi:fermentation-respiration switch protein FrsA (DUF1100 family)